MLFRSQRLGFVFSVIAIITFPVLFFSTYVVHAAAVSSITAIAALLYLAAVGVLYRVVRTSTLWHDSVSLYSYFIPTLEHGSRLFHPST